MLCFANRLICRERDDAAVRVPFCPKMALGSGMSSRAEKTRDKEGYKWIAKTWIWLAKTVLFHIALHGGGGNAGNAERMTGFTEKAEKEGFIVVYPEGTGPFRKKHLTWNGGHCCGIAMQRRMDDVGFIGVLLDNFLPTTRWIPSGSTPPACPTAA
jgi:hypothetical protein